MKKQENVLFNSFEANCIPTEGASLKRLQSKLEDACQAAATRVSWQRPLVLDKKSIFMLWWSGNLPNGCFSHDDALIVDRILKRGIDNLVTLTTTNPVQVRIANECANVGLPLPCST